MRMQSPAITSRPGQSGGERRGFTLLELLIVMGIIAFLISILATVWGNYQERAQETATTATIVKINRLLDQRLKSLAEAFGRENLKGALDRKAAEIGDPNHANGPVFQLQKSALRAWVFKDRVRAAFPQRFEDLYGPDAAPGVAGDDDDGNGTTDFDAMGNPDILELGYAGSDDTAPAITAALRKLNASPNVSLTTHDRDTESAELLYIALTQADVIGSAAVDSDAFQGKELADTDGDGLMEFVDAWGRPIRFYRWPTRLIRPVGEDANGNGTLDTGEDLNNNGILDSAGVGLDRLVTDLLIQGLPAEPSSDQRDPLDTDPDDPSGSLLAGILAQSNMINHFNEATYHTLETHHVPLIVSAGGDGVLGLFEPYFLERDADGSGDISGTEDTNSNGAFDYGTLAQPKTDLDDDGTNDWTFGNAGDGPLNDNITNRNRRIGGN